MKHAILKMIDYPGADLGKFKKVADYLRGQNKTKPKYVISHYLSPDSAAENVDLIERRWNFKGSRLFKHGVFAFGDPALTPAAALEATKDVMAYYADFPWIAAVHLDRAPRLHSHFLLVCRNLKTGRKLEQSPSDLCRFKEFYGSVAEKLGLPLLKGYEAAVIADNDTESTTEPSQYFGEENAWPEYALFPPQVPVRPVEVQSAMSPVLPFAELLMDRYRVDFQKFYELGKGKGDSNV